MRIRSVAVLTAIFCLIGGTVAESYPRRTLKWADEFGGSAGQLPISQNWSFEAGGYGWGNNELQCYTKVPGNVATDGSGHLVITAIKQPGHRCVDGRTNDYTSARITTQSNFTTTYGRLEMRAKVPAGVGTWPAFWALGADIGEVGWPRSGEIDVMEAMGREPTKLLGSVHGPDAKGDRYYVTRQTRAVGPLGDRFRVYAVEWTPTQMVYSLDGRPYASIRRSEVERQGRWVFDKPFYLLLNLAVGGTLGGSPDATSTWPQRYVIDYVRVYA